MYHEFITKCSEMKCIYIYIFFLNNKLLISDSLHAIYICYNRTSNIDTCPSSVQRTHGLSLYRNACEMKADFLPVILKWKIPYVQHIFYKL